MVMSTQCIPPETPWWLPSKTSHILGDHVHLVYTARHLDGYLVKQVIDEGDYVHLVYAAKHHDGYLTKQVIDEAEDEY